MDHDRLTRYEVLRVLGRVSGYDYDDLQQEARVAVWQREAEMPAHVRRCARSALQRLRLASLTQGRHPTDQIGRLLPIVPMAHARIESHSFEPRHQLEARLILDVLRRAHPTQFATLVATWEQNGSLTSDDPECHSALQIARSFIDRGSE